jgi:hypothetical protein
VLVKVKGKGVALQPTVNNGVLAALHGDKWLASRTGQFIPGEEPSIHIE